MNKAFTVSYKYGDCCWLVYAKNASRARAITRGSDGDSCYDDYTDLRAKREPMADKWATDKECIESDRRKRRELGWWSTEGGGYCADCELYEWPDIDESELIEIGDDWLCKECAKKRETEQAGRS